MSESEFERVKPPYSASAEVDLLTERLRHVAVGEIITYEEMSSAIAESAISPRGRSIVTRARERVKREESIIFRTVKGVGYERCDDPGKLLIVRDGVRSVNRKAKRTQRTLEAVELDKLDQKNRESYLLNKTLLSILRQGSAMPFIKAASKRLEHWNPGTINLLRLLGRKKDDDETSP